MNFIFIGVIILFAAYAVNRYLMTNATKKLDDRTKLEFSEAFSKRNDYFTFFFLALVIIYFGAIQFFPEYNLAVSFAYLTIYIVYLIFKFAYNYKKLKQLGASAQYMKSFIISYGIFLAGFLSFAICLMYAWL